GRRLSATDRRRGTAGGCGRADPVRTAGAAAGCRARGRRAGTGGCVGLRRPRAGAGLVGRFPGGRGAGGVEQRAARRGPRSAASSWLAARGPAGPVRRPGRRGVPAGLGVPAFAELPPAAVEVWDRYLAYGAALGVTSVTGVIDLGLQHGGYAWSGYGGRLRRVRVPGRRLAAIGGPVSLAQIVVGLGEVGLIVAWIVIASPVGAGRAALAIGPVMLALPRVYLPGAGLLNV